MFRIAVMSSHSSRLFSPCLLRARVNGTHGDRHKRDTNDYSLRIRIPPRFIEYKSSIKEEETLS